MIMSRSDKPSPHSSPRMTRRSQTPNCCSMSSSTSLQSDIYISQQSTSTSSPSPHPRQTATSTAGPQSSLPTAPSMQSINTNTTQSTPFTGSNYNSGNPNVNANSNYAATSNCRTNSRPNSSSSTTVGVSSAVPSNRMSAPTSGSVNAACPPFNKVLNKALSADLNDLHSHVDEIAPPLPPRKSSPNVDSFANNSVVNRLLKPHSSGYSPSVTAASSLSNLAASASSSNSRSSENITLCDFDVPHSVAPPIPKHNVVTGPPLPLKIGLVNEQQSAAQLALSDSRLLELSSDDDPDKVIVGPAETISGIIDTRPLESRKPAIVSSNSLDKDPMRTHLSNDSNNVYHLKNNSNQNLTRNPSFPNSHSTSCTSLPSASNSAFPNSKSNSPKSHTIQSPVHDEATAAASSTADGLPPHLPLLYENVTISQKDCGNGVPYENINLEYIATLMREGYSKENVVAALGISRNNIEMAWDILNEFVTKNGG